MKLQLFITWFLVWSSITAFGQVDPSAEILLRNSSSSAEEEDIEKGRYTRSVRRNQRNTQTRPTTRPSPPTAKSSKNPKANAEADSKPSVENKEVADATQNPNGPVTEKPSELEVMKDLMPTRGNQATQEYFRQIDREDSRRNILDISVAPMFFSVHSDSNYWYRDYRSYGPGLGLGASIWFSPFLGLTTSIKSSLSTDIVGNPAATESLSADHLWVDVGFIFRRFTTLKKNSSLIKYGLGFRDYALKIPSDSNQRVNINTSGVLLSVEWGGEVKEGKRNNFGVEIVPKANHIENYAAVNIQSGNDNETNIVGVWVGQEFEFTRKQKVFWRLKHSFEKSLFGGSANVTDPETGVAPTGVVVNQSKTFLQLGINFGN